MKRPDPQINCNKAEFIFVNLYKSYQIVIQVRYTRTSSLETNPSTIKLLKQTETFDPNAMLSK